jgi:hypothetical protein
MEKEVAHLKKLVKMLKVNKISSQNPSYYRKSCGR